VLQQLADKFDVFLSTGSEFAKREVMFIKAQTDRAMGIMHRKFDETLVPSFRDHCGFGAYAVSIIPKFLVKWRKFSKGSIDFDGFGGIVARIGTPSMDFLRLRGASGWDARIDWLPITTKTFSPVTDAAARRI
jgi:hypothetical protein